ncbi:MAG TPA: APC family permease [Candidatus Limnocylindrales bacterium]|nr:APC family permease [Candidatus Limnocylindrales bacterium]
MSTEAGINVAAAPRLRRSLTLRDLILYGIIVIQPVAPMSVFGVLNDRGRGHVVTAILIAMVAMLFTGISYGRMARAYPSAGSAFTYVAQEVNPAMGYITGWSMVMDYMLNPLICTVWCAVQAAQFAPGVPAWIWKVFFAVVFTLLNVRGVKTSARINSGMAIAMGAVVMVIFVVAARFIFGQPHGDPIYFTRPFYDPERFSYGGLFGCTSIAVLTYIGFDGISTLSEEAENPRRNILLATVLTCVVIGLLSAVEVYIAQLVWPAGQPFANVDTAYVEVMKKLWPSLAVFGKTIAPLSVLVGGTLLLANFGSGMGAQLGAARLLYGMGRSNALPKSFFGAVDPKHHIPRNNVFVVGAVALVGAFLLEIVAGFRLYLSGSGLTLEAVKNILNGGAAYGLGAEMLNFGALIAFMGVNVAAFLRYFVRSSEKKLGFLIPPVLGFVICFGLWINLSKPAIIVGSIWMAAGIAFGIWKTRGFREPLSFELPPEE